MLLRWLRLAKCRIISLAWAWTFILFLWHTSFRAYITVFIHFPSQNVRKLYHCFSAIMAPKGSKMEIWQAACNSRFRLLSQMYWSISFILAFTDLIHPKFSVAKSVATRYFVMVLKVNYFLCSLSTRGLIETQLRNWFEHFYHHYCCSNETILILSGLPKPLLHSELSYASWIEERASEFLHCNAANIP